MRSRFFAHLLCRLLEVGVAAGVLGLAQTLVAALA